MMRHDNRNRRERSRSRSQGRDKLLQRRHDARTSHSQFTNKRGSFTRTQAFSRERLTSDTRERHHEHRSNRVDFNKPNVRHRSASQERHRPQSTDAPDPSSTHRQYSPKARRSRSRSPRRHEMPNTRTEESSSMFTSRRQYSPSRWQETTTGREPDVHMSHGKYDFEEKRLPSSSDPPLRMNPSKQDYEQESFNQRVTADVPIPRPVMPKLSDRFKQPLFTPFVLEDNIMIGIQRSRNVEPSPFVNIKEVFDAGLFAMLRSKEEGTKPIFEREEILRFCHDDKMDVDEGNFERRIISIQPTLSSTRVQDDSRSVHDTGRMERITNPIVRRGEPWETDHLQIIKRRSRSPHAGPTMKVRLDKRSEEIYKERYFEEDKEQREIRPTRIGKFMNDPHDLRHNLTSRSHSDTNLDARARIEARRRDDRSGGRNESRERRNDDGDHLRERERSRPAERDHSRDARSDSRNQGEAPDFSKRADKYMYEAWKEKPEMIPKGSSYFEHDNREDSETFHSTTRGGFNRGGWKRDNFDGRTRGRSSFRSRGSQFSHHRGSRDPSRPFVKPGNRGRSTFEPRGRGRMGFGRTSSPWKHDMFDKIDKSEDEKPTSTTKDKD